MNHNPDDLLVWLDLETTGLNPHRCSIIQMGIIITDNDLNEIEAAESARVAQLNPQHQEPFVWPPSFAVARSYVDQLVRNRGLATARITRISAPRSRQLSGAKIAPARSQA